MTATMINLTKMPVGNRYEDTYGMYLDVFERVAVTPLTVIPNVKNPPMSWIPLLQYLGAKVQGGQKFFDVDFEMGDQGWYQMKGRTAVEAMCGMRPELVDALWKCDMQWSSERLDECKGALHYQEFSVTCNGSFYRPELIAFMKEVDAYRSEYRQILLVPCAADKPYPAPLHKAVLKVLPEGWELAIATGVLGIVPQCFWPQMPRYDSGLPNEWRLYKRTKKYFATRTYTAIVCYVDYYSIALYEAFTSLRRYPVPIFINPIKFYYDYLDLLNHESLTRLKHVLRSVK